MICVLKNRKCEQRRVYEFVPLTYMNMKCCASARAAMTAGSAVGSAMSSVVNSTSRFLFKLIEKGQQRTGD